MYLGFSTPTADGVAARTQLREGPAVRPNLKQCIRHARRRFGKFERLQPHGTADTLLKVGTNIMRSRESLKAIRFQGELLPDWAQLLDLAASLSSVPESTRQRFSLFTSRTGVDARER